MIINNLRGQSTCPDCCQSCTQSCVQPLTIVDSRSRFSRRTLFGVAGLGVAGMVVGCSNDKGDTSPDVPEVVVSAAEVPAIDAAPYRSATGNFYLVQNSNGVLAFSWACTHQGCEVPWKENEGRFHCPCHGSIFDRNGVRTDGPAKRPLDLLQVSVAENGNVTVATEVKTERSDYEPEQAVPYTTRG